MTAPAVSYDYGLWTLLLVNSGIYALICHPQYLAFIIMTSQGGRIWKD
ncbi:hypothetical protein [Mariprofundus ferrooxydans]|uniref:Uncharacterized protein n=1 Tax=Mariprofundus ferrooxydans PV-1 TaxID=314345 RepID=Q0F1K2_9PROT|nr:hypothetical protein [Mariprofundus ferrooxydans]EAU55189.1 hypothetical protein SPV1_10671 [Mariprofundus ferrooxydans PV-1]